VVQVGRFYISLDYIYYGYEAYTCVNKAQEPDIEHRGYYGNGKK